MRRIIDTHIHVWNLEKAAYPWLARESSILNRSWHIEELFNERKEAGITQGVLVQASGNIDDTNMMLETAGNTDWISGVVCWLPLQDPEETKRLLDVKFLGDKYFKGVRHQIHDEADTKWLLQPAVLESLELLAEKNIPFDVVAVVPAHIETALEVANKIPGLRMVFDHLSQPPIKTKEKFGEWGQLMQSAAQHEQFFAKLSGLGTASGNVDNWTSEDIKPYVAFVLEYFGPRRIFCGGDWPVSELAGGYIKTWTIYQQVISDLLDDDGREMVFYDNARQFYNL